MRNTILAASILATCSACEAPSAGMPTALPSDSFALSETGVGAAVDGRPTYGVPVPVPGRDAVVIPFARETTVSWFGDADRFAEGGGSSRQLSRSSVREDTRSSASNSIRWHNAIIHDFDSGGQSPVLREKGILSRYWMRFDASPPSNEWRCTALLFAATVEDSNGDGVLDDRDAMRALVADLEGGPARFVTPAGTNLASLAFDPRKDRALLFVTTDTNGDGEFTKDEAPEPYILDLGDQKVSAYPLVTDASKTIMGSALDGQSPMAAPEVIE